MDAFDDCPDTQRTPVTCARMALDLTVDALGADEIRVLTRIADRLKQGATLYGPFQLEKDLRDFRGHEAREELEDALVYLACAWLKAQSADAKAVSQ